MQLTPVVHLAGSGALGLGLTDPYDCNAYLVDCGDTCALIDTGAGYQIDALVTEIHRSGFSPGQVAALLLTHEHADHSGGAATLQELTGAPVFATPLTAQRVMSADEINGSLDDARRSGSFPKNYEFRAVPVDNLITPGEPITIGTRAFSAIPTPGHCAGHCSFVLNADGLAHLFSGDALLPGGQIVLQAIADCSVAESVASIHSLEPLHTDLLLAGHLAPVLSRGHHHVALALERIRSGHLPHQLRLPGQLLSE